MSPFTPQQLEALVELEAHLGEGGFVLIGASALGCWLSSQWRRTNDVDLVLVGSVGDCERAMSELPHWTRDPRVPHRWYSARKLPVDIIPASPALLAAGAVTFPDGTEISLAGMDLPFSHYGVYELSTHVAIRVATVPVITVLEMSSWQERPSDRERDLADLGHIMRLYVEDDDERRYDGTFPEDVEWEHVGAFALGLDVAKIITEIQRELVESFLSIVERDDIVAARFARLAGLVARSPARELRALLATFAKGARCKAEA